MKTPKFELIDAQDRTKLAEGRNSGFGSGFAKLNKSQLVMVQPLTACKDFLSDLVWTQATKQSFSAHGLRTEYIEGLFTDKAYLVIGILKQNRSSQETDKYLSEVKLLNCNYKNLQKFMNWFEEQFGANKTIIKKVENNRYICILDSFFCKGTYLISLYTLLLRIGMYYKEGNPLEFCDSFKEGEDYMLYNTCKDKIVKMLNKDIPEQDLSKVSNPHNLGICQFQWPIKVIPPKPVELSQIWA